MLVVRSSTDWSPLAELSTSTKLQVLTQAGSAAGVSLCSAWDSTSSLASSRLMLHWLSCSVLARLNSSDTEQLVIISRQCWWVELSRDDITALLNQLLLMSSSPDHLHGKVSILNFSIKSKFIFRISRGDFVNPEKLLYGLEEAGVLGHGVLHRLHLPLSRLRCIESQNFPICLPAVQQPQDSQDLKHKQ